MGGPAGTAVPPPLRRRRSAAVDGVVALCSPRLAAAHGARWRLRPAPGGRAGGAGGGGAAPSRGVWQSLTTAAVATTVVPAWARRGAVSPPATATALAFAAPPAPSLVRLSVVAPPRRAGRPVAAAAVVRRSAARPCAWTPAPALRRAGGGCRWAAGGAAPLPKVASRRDGSAPPAGAATGASSWRCTDKDFLEGLELVLSMLVSTVVVIPVFKRLKVSPILGFLLVGVLLGPHGLKVVKDVEEITPLADVGVLFLLFEMGLELSFDRLRKLRKYAFGLGLAQMAACTTLLGLGAYGMGASTSESLVVGSALSLSSSAFILQLLAERGERQSRAGIATFGVLLFQDIAVVPLLVLVPLFSYTSWTSLTHLPDLVRSAGVEVAKVLAALSVFVVLGGQLLRRVFQFVADSDSSEAFTASVLLTVLGTAFLTDELGLSMTLGAFIAGVLLAESSFRSRIAVDTEPFRGLFLGLFFITTGMSLNGELLVTQPGAVAFLVSSLVFCKAAVVTLVGLPFGLSLAESVRVGLLIGQGGEFAFVLFALAERLGYLPPNIYDFLVTVVVVSMAATPLLYTAGLWLAPRIDRWVERQGGVSTISAQLADFKPAASFFAAAAGTPDPDDKSLVPTSIDRGLLGDEEVVILFGFGPVGRVVGRMLSRKFIRWVAVDSDPDLVQKASRSGLPVVLGDATLPREFLEASGISGSGVSAFVITVSDYGIVRSSLTAVRAAYPDRPVFVRARDVAMQKELLSLGANSSFPEMFETSVQLGAEVLRAFGTSKLDLSSIKREVRGDSGLGDAFSKYEAWYQENMRAPQSPTEGGVSNREGGEGGGGAAGLTFANGEVGGHAGGVAATAASPSSSARAAAPLSVPAPPSAPVSADDKKGP